jgi:hypothetical protein
MGTVIKRIFWRFLKIKNLQFRVLKLHKLFSILKGYLSQPLFFIYRKEFKLKINDVLNPTNLGILPHRYKFVISKLGSQFYIKKKKKRQKHRKYISFYPYRQRFFSTRNYKTYWTKKHQRRAKKRNFLTKTATNNKYNMRRFLPIFLFNRNVLQQQKYNIISTPKRFFQTSYIPLKKILPTSQVEINQKNCLQMQQMFKIQRTEALKKFQKRRLFIAQQKNVLQRVKIAQQLTSKAQRTKTL